MNVEEIRKKVRSLCEDAGLQFFFAVPNASEWAVTDCEHLRKIVSYHKELETLPPVTPTRKTGKWIIDDKENNRIWHCHCSECKKDPQNHVGGSENWWLVRLPNYCPNCGAKMGSEEE